MVGVYLTAMTIAALVSNIWVGHISDRHGNRRLLMISGVVGLAAPALALMLGFSHASPLLFAVVFAFNGVYNTSAILAHINFLLDIAPAGDRPIYYGTANTLVGLGILASSGGGAVVEWLGYPYLFLLAGFMLLVALVLVLTLRDPRGGAFDTGRL